MIFQIGMTSGEVLVGQGDQYAVEEGLLRLFVNGDRFTTVFALEDVAWFSGPHTPGDGRAVSTMPGMVGQ